MKVLIPLCALVLSGCTGWQGWQIGGKTPTPPSTTSQVSPDVLTSIDAAIANPPGRSLPPPVARQPEPQVIAFTSAPEPVLAPKKESKPLPLARPEPVTLPTSIIKEAQRAAQVEPQKRGYHGQSATQRWIWQPGKLYVVYVSPQQMTKIVLPPGELLISKVFLPADAWDVQSYRVGSETVTHDVIFVRPLLTDEGKVLAKDVDLALLTEQGRSFDVHLKVGTVGMFAVTWENPSMPQLLQDEPQQRGQ